MSLTVEQRRLLVTLSLLSLLHGIRDQKLLPMEQGAGRLSKRYG